MKNSKVGVVIALLIKWSGIAVTDGRNKVGGTVLSKSRAGATARNKVTPINRRSTAQQAVRSFFSHFSQQFRTLGAATISAWNEFVKGNITLTNIFGDTFTLVGNTAFIRLNMNLSSAGAANILTPPSVDLQPDGVSSVSADGDVSATELYLTTSFITAGGNIVPTDNALLVYATPKLSKGQTYVKSQLRLLRVMDAATNTSTENIWNDYTAKYGAPSVDDNIHFAVQLVQTQSGFSSTPFNAVARIVA